MSQYGSRKMISRIAVVILLIICTAYLFCLPRELFTTPYSTVVTDRHGELLGARIADDGQWRFPTADSVPTKLRTCLITFEDRHFYRHWGVNPLSIMRAARQNHLAGRIVSGGSTITMQVIRLSRHRPRTLSEKFIEMILATRLEFRLSKAKILALYASHAPFGGNVVGMDAAAWRYFGHNVASLSWAEAATLAVLPNSPSAIHLSRSRATLRAKRNRLLERLHAQGTIDDSDYELALAEELPAAPLPLPSIAPHLVDHYYLTRRGQRITSSLDRGIQQQIEALTARYNEEFARSDIRDLAALVIDVRTRRVVAYCGNARTTNQRSGSQVDIIRAPRSTGSILKPLLYYIMLQEGELLPRTLFADIPTNINGFSPQNFNRKFEGAVPASEAIARSLNVPTVQMLRAYGVPKFHAFLRQAGISTLTQPSAHYGLSLILGGAEATLWDVSMVYTDMARALLGEKNLFHAGAVWQCFDAIKEVNRPEEIDWRTIPSMQTIAWKTGTSYGFRDGWAVGVTPKYVVGVWVGNASGEGRPGLVGARTAGPVIFDIFNLLPSSAWFEKPVSEFVEAEICHQSGHLKGRFCTTCDTLQILPAGLKTAACPYHHLVRLSADGSQRISADSQGVQVSRFTLPPAWEWYYKQYHPEYQPLPPLRAAGSDPRSPMQFIYPQMHARVLLPRQLDGSAGEVTFELVHSNPNTIIFWHLDNEYLTRTQDFHKVTLSPAVGRHTMTVVDDRGNSCSTTFSVE